MANKKLFGSVGSKVSKVVPPVNAVNNSGGMSYALGCEQELAQLACTGTLGGTYYTSSKEELNNILSRALKVSPKFLAELAVYSRTEGFMKDAPALLLAVLFARDVKLCERVFSTVIDNGKMLRNFCQIVRSGQTGRKSFGTAGKRMIRNWINSRSMEALFNDDVGNDPSLADIIKMVHPKGENAVREAFYGYLIDKVSGTDERLPVFIKSFEAFKTASKGSRTLPEGKINFQRFTALDLSKSEWEKLALNMGWTATRINLNTFSRHGLYDIKGFTDAVASKLASKEQVAKSNVFPYQLMTAYNNVDSSIPIKVKNALQDAMEHATENIPSFGENLNIIVAVDSSGSMSDPITGNRGSATTVTSCNQVASLIAACVLRKNQNTTVMRFDTEAKVLNLNPRDSVMTLSKQIANNGGGTSVSSPVALANKNGIKADLFILVSDNESWVDRNYNFNYGWNSNKQGTTLANEWETFKKKNPNAKLVCIDLVPNTTAQVTNAKERMNIGGMNDQIFEVIAAFMSNKSNDPNFWVNKIKEKVNLQ